MRTLLTWVLFACLFATGASAAEVLRAAYEDKAEPPFYMGDTSEVPGSPGVSVELVREAAAELGIEVQFQRMPWVRCLKSLQRGEVDLTFNASFKEERLEFGVYPTVDGKLDPSRRITTLTYALYRLKGSHIAWDGTKISGLDGPVGIQSGYSVKEDLTRLGVPTEEASDTQVNFKKLTSKRIPAVAQLEVTADTLLARGDFPSVEKVTPALVKKDYFVIVSHQFYEAKRELAEKLWTKVGELRETRLTALHAKYAR
ncbi:MAG: substrate-binding periplasmic protein [Actinomycetota bacterium]